MVFCQRDGLVAVRQDCTRVADMRCPELDTTEQANSAGGSCSAVKPVSPTWPWNEGTNEGTKEGKEKKNMSRMNVNTKHIH